MKEDKMKLRFFKKSLCKLAGIVMITNVSTALQAQNKMEMQADLNRLIFMQLFSNEQLLIV